MKHPQVTVHHEGRGGYVTIEGFDYGIEMCGSGFVIFFPGGNRHTRMQIHLDALRAYAKTKDPEWCVENRSRNYR